MVVAMAVGVTAWEEAVMVMEVVEMAPGREEVHLARGEEEAARGPRRLQIRPL